MKQTAVEWLVEQFKTYDNEIHYLYSDEIKQAKAMEKEQIMKSNRDGVDMCVDKKPFITAEQYYDETYHSDKDKPDTPTTKDRTYSEGEVDELLKLIRHNETQWLLFDKGVVKVKPESHDDVIKRFKNK